MTYGLAVAPWEAPTLPIRGSAIRFPVRRVFCIGKNYADHIREMGGTDISAEAAVFFIKPADCVVADGSRVAYPPMTRNLHHEVELVAAIGRAGGNVAVDDALSLVYGYAVGVDLTRRDLQNAARDRGGPWDMAKSFDQAAPVGALARVESFGHPQAGRIWLEVDGEMRQQADLSQMIRTTAEVIAELSRFIALKPGDVVFTGTPAGVGPIARGQKVRAGIEHVGELTFDVI